MLPGEYLDLEDAFLGGTITRIEREADQIAFTLSTGGRLVMYDSQNGSNCHVVGELADLIDRPIVVAADLSDTPECPDGVVAQLGTDKGAVAFQWLTAETVDIVAPIVRPAAEGRG